VVAPEPASDWSFMDLERVRFGEHELSLHWHDGGRPELLLRYSGPSLTIGFRLRIPADPALPRLVLNGEQVPPTMVRRQTRGEHHWLEVWMEPPPGVDVVLTLQRTPLPLNILARISQGQEDDLPGGPTAHVQITNEGREPFSGTLYREGDRLADIDGLGPGETRELRAAVPPPARAYGHFPYQLMLRAGNGAPIWSEEVDLVVFAPLEAWLEGPGVALAGREALVRLRLSGPARAPRSATVTFEVVGQERERAEQLTLLGWGEQVGLSQRLRVGRGREARVRCRIRTEDVELEREVTIPLAAADQPLVIYCGFLAPPLTSQADLFVYHVPANYAVRRPDRLLDILPDARALMLTDQQDAVLSSELSGAIREYVEGGGRLLFFCSWSAAWGRGFHQTYCSIARTELPRLLPLDFADGIGTTGRLQLEGAGGELWAGLPWAEAPPLDYNRARLKEAATCWARAEDGTPVAAASAVGRGRVVAIGLDCFGFGHGTVVHWPGQRPLLRRALDWLLAPAGP
jgi:hypothetical protein